MSPSLDEALSALLAGDLPADEAAALRARIDTEPEVAQAWAEMQQLLADLDALPPDHPELLAPPVRIRPVPANRSWGWAAAVAAVAAVLVAWLSLGAGSPEVIVGSGETLLDGQLSLMAGDVSIDLDGRALISVEPVGPVVRGEQHTFPEDPMNRTAILAGLAGVAVTVTVYEGTARVHAHEGEAPVTVTPGAPHHVRGGVPAVAALPGPGPARDAALEARVEALQAELATIEGELATERFGAAITRGQLKAEQGEPSEWPDEASDALREERIRDELATRLDELEGFGVQEVDCYEFPCIVALHYTGDDDTLEWGRPVADEVGAWAEEQLDDANISMTQSIFREDGEPDARFVLFAVDDGTGGEGTGDRTEWRLDQLSGRLGDDARAEP